MESLPVWAQLLALFLLLLLSAFFSISETSMMALNRYRLAHLVRQGRRGALRTSRLLAETDRLLGTILLGNNVVNTALTAIVTALAISYFGNNDTVVLAASSVVAIAIIIFCELTPKVFGASYPERIALPASLPLAGLMRLLTPFVWAANLLVSGILSLVGYRRLTDEEQSLSQEELRTIVLEGGRFIPNKHRSILLNLFDLDDITIDDVMVPRQRIEALDLSADEATLREQLATCYHNKLPVYDGEINRVVGVLHVRRALSLLQRETFNADDLREHLDEPYFVPSETPVFRQLQAFQETRRRFGLVVDEYGELLGMVTLADIVEELVGEFTSSGPGRDAGPSWDEDGTIQLEGSVQLRELNRRLGTRFPLDGPRTLNGLVLEALQELPEADVAVRFGDIVAEVTHIEDRTIRSVKLIRLTPGQGSQAK
ncbi:MAG: HlyC/CorC family transporter [Burkholderiaceae bacterium]|nr:HlyC/CorC family transporter [Burkholderiaceae bacterium]